MVQGTASSVGKSLLVAALCRILRQDGYRVAPFKAQNMSLNAAVTADGREISRATAVQAAAAGVEPTVEMNPILLKPEAEARSQVIVLGRPAATLSARDYYARKAALWGVVSGALDRVRAAYDVVVIEGAGSPAEVNLRAGDIVNMRVARYAAAPVLLVGDIDRGGVFAALVGTLELLEPDERALVGGFIINKFRGDRTLLEPGLDFLVGRTGRPVLGVIPYLPRLHVAEEDGVALEQQAAGHGNGPIDIAVARLPRIANFDDFDLLAAEPAVRLRYVAEPRDLGRPDLVILPGSKATVADLGVLRDSGLAARIVALARAGTPVLGICGGYQMLGQSLADPDGVESSTREAPGLGLLPVQTTFGTEKRTRRVRVRAIAGVGPFGRLGDTSVAGYELHMGRTDGGTAPLFRVAGEGEAERVDGCRSADGMVAGTYLHGLFEHAPVRQALIGWLGARRGLQLEAGMAPSREAEYERLAAVVRAALDLAAVYRLLEGEG
jgi:adenosylcobyric acid synthase